jgi:HSP20 family protein
MRFDPISELERFQQEVDDLFTGPSGAVHQYPAINVWSNDNEAYLTAELPGVESNDLEISVLGQKLTLSGQRKPVELDSKPEWHRGERLHGKFTRTLQLPFRVDAQKVDAHMAKGVLTVKLPRAEEDKPKKISIQAA